MNGEGRVTGSNHGRIRIGLTSVPSGLVVEARLDDDTHCVEFLLGTASEADGELRAVLSSRGVDSGQQFGVVTVIARAADDGALAGELSTSVGTSGTLVASGAAPAPPTPQSLGFSRFGIVLRRIRIPACVVNDQKTGVLQHRSDQRSSFSRDPGPSISPAPHPTHTIATTTTSNHSRQPLAQSCPAQHNSRRD